MYEISNYSDKIRNTHTGDIFQRDEREELYPAFLAWQKAENALIEVDFFEGEEDIKISVEWLSKLQSVAASLRIKAKAAAIGKTGTQEYIFSQVELYELKYKVASGQIVNEYIDTLLENEAIEFGLSIDNFKFLIIYMYTTAKQEYEVFLFMIERCRTKIQTLIEAKNWGSVSQAFIYINSLSDAGQAQTIMQQILDL